MARVQGLLSRVRARFGGTVTAPAAVGQAWSSPVAEAWSELDEAIDAQLKRPGTAAVSTWEVCAAELARRVIGEEGEAALVTRFSDALVPTLDALGTLHKALPAALAEGRAAGQRAGTLAAATRPLVLLPHGLGPELATAWAKTAAWLEPVVVTAANAEAARARLLAVGPRLAEGASAAEATLREALSRLPQATSPTAGLVDPFEQWADALVRSIEVEIYGGAKGMIGELRP